MKALIFAAGLGTRLKPLTDTVPKALVEVGGKPLLKIIADKLTGSGISDICVNVHHHSDKIKEYVVSSGLDMSISDESDMLRDTGGGIKHAGRFLKDGGAFLVHNVDILTNADLAWLEASHRPGALATLLVSRRETGRYLYFDGDMRLRGWENTRTGEIRSPFPGFSPEGCRRLAFDGIHVISGDVLGIMEDWPEKFQIMDFYLSVADRYPIFGTEARDLRFIDVGKPETLAEARRLHDCGDRFWE